MPTNEYTWKDIGMMCHILNTSEKNPKFKQRGESPRLSLEERDWRKHWNEIDRSAFTFSNDSLDALVSTSRSKSLESIWKELRSDVNAS